MASMQPSVGKQLVLDPSSSRSSSTHADHHDIQLNSKSKSSVKEDAKVESDQSQAAASPDPSKTSRKPLSFWMIMLALCASCFLSALDLTAITTALPTIAHDLKSDNFSWVGSSYALSSTAFLPVFGGLAQAFGRKPPLMTCIVIFAIGSAVCGSATSIGALLTGRTIQGIGVGCLSSILFFCIQADCILLLISPGRRNPGTDGGRGKSNHPPSTKPQPMLIHTLVYRYLISYHWPSEDYTWACLALSGPSPRQSVQSWVVP